MKTNQNIQETKNMILKVNEIGYESTKQSVENFLNKISTKIKENNFINSLTETWFDIYVGARNRRQRCFSEKQAYYLAKYMVEQGF